MKQRWIQSVLLIAMAGFVAACGDADKDGRTSASARDLSGRAIKVVSTIGMITDAVQQIGGDRVQVSGLMGPGVDPHLYKASEGDVRRLGEADVIFYNGLHLEAKMAAVMAQMNRRIKTVPIAEAVDPSLLLAPPEFEGAHDPHIWFDVSLWMEAVDKIRQTLEAIDPQHQAEYRRNAARYASELEQLNSYISERAELVPAQKRVIVTAHDAFNYFGRAYGFQVRGLQGISTATEAGTGDIQDLAEFIADRKIPAIFVESSVPPRTIEAVQAAVRSRGHDVAIGGELFSDALGSAGTPEGKYVGMVRHNIDTIVAALTR